MINKRPLRVLVVDDTVVYRMTMKEILGELPDVEVVGTANNGKIALSKIALLKPDLLTLDIEMPDMNGLQVLEHMKKKFPAVGAIVISGVTSKGSKMTMKALELGAFDFIPKPDAGSMEKNRQILKEAIALILKGFARHREIRIILHKEGPLTAERKKETSERTDDLARRMKAVSENRLSKSLAVAIGISTGGPKALAQVLPSLPAHLGVPIFIAQHMPPVFTKALADKLDMECKMKVKEARDGEPVHPDTVYIAPGGKQMKVIKNDRNEPVVRITEDPPENSCRPSADYLFRSVALVYGARTTGVIMTGMGSDGTRGLRIMKEIGATVIAQNENTSVVYGMPREASKAGIVDITVPLNQIANEIMKTIQP